MNKQTEALKLALEALEQSHPEAYRHIITAIREALAEQPAQQEPVAWLIWLHGPAGHFDHKQFAELEFERRNKEYPDPDRKLLPLYTSPPASKPWVGLTGKEVYDLADADPHGGALRLYCAIEAKLKEKNNG